MCLADQGVQQQYNTSISLHCEPVSPRCSISSEEQTDPLTADVHSPTAMWGHTLCTLSPNLCNLHSFGGPSNTILILNISLLFCISVFIFLEEDSFFLYPLKKGLITVLFICSIVIKKVSNRRELQEGVAEVADILITPFICTATALYVFWSYALSVPGSG